MKNEMGSGTSIRLLLLILVLFLAGIAGLLMMYHAPGTIGQKPLSQKAALQRMCEAGDDWVAGWEACKKCYGPIMDAEDKITNGLGELGFTGPAVVMVNCTNLTVIIFSKVGTNDLGIGLNQLIIGGVSNAMAINESEWRWAHTNMADKWVMQLF